MTALHASRRIHYFQSKQLQGGKGDALVIWLEINNASTGSGETNHLQSDSNFWRELTAEGVMSRTTSPGWPADDDRWPHYVRVALIAAPTGTRLGRGMPCCRRRRRRSCWCWYYFLPFVSLSGQAAEGRSICQAEQKKARKRKCLCFVFKWKSPNDSNVRKKKEKVQQAEIKLRARGSYCGADRLGGSAWNVGLPDPVVKSIIKIFAAPLIKTFAASCCCWAGTEWLRGVGLIISSSSWEKTSALSSTEELKHGYQFWGAARELGRNPSTLCCFCFCFLFFFSPSLPLTFLLTEAFEGRLYNSLFFSLNPLARLFLSILRPGEKNSFFFF